MTASSIIEALRTYIATYPGLASGALLEVNSLNDKPVSYGIVPQPGSRVLETYLDESSERAYPFALQSAKSTVDDLARIEALNFFEAFSDWLEEQTQAGNLPSLPSGKTATKIEATNQAYLSIQGESGTGIYQVTCVLTYDQDAPA